MFKTQFNNTPYTQITSLKNDHFKKWQSLLSTKGIKKHQQFLIMGKKIIQENLPLAKGFIFSKSMGPECIENYKIFFKKSSKLSFPLCFELDNVLFNELDIFGTYSPILVGEKPSVPHACLADKPQGLEVLVALGDPRNLGAALRSCEGFDVSKIILLQESAHPFLPQVIKVSNGSSLRVHLAQGPSIHNVPSKGVVALDMRGMDLKDYQWSLDTRLIAGEEGLGFPEDFEAHRVTIPISKKLDSLNSNVALSIALYDYSVKKNK